jgi:hypothetical protein
VVLVRGVDDDRGVDEDTVAWPVEVGDGETSTRPPGDVQLAHTAMQTIAAARRMHRG